MDNVTIKGNKDGLNVYINSGSFENIMNELICKIENAKDFFTGCDLYIVDKESLLTIEHYDRLKSSLKSKFNINLFNPETDNLIERNDKMLLGIYEGRTRFYKTTIRSGQKINYNGNVVVIGDVNSGAEVSATGNIVVLGVLRGIAHAGSNGNKKAFVAAYMLKPSQLRIADIITRSPDNGIEKPKMPEIAKIKDDTIVIEPYLLNKYL